MRWLDKLPLKKILGILLPAFFVAVIAMEVDVYLNKPSIPSSEITQSADETVSKKDKFDLSMEMMKGYYDALESRSEKTVALLLVLIGWLITSDTARKSLKNEPALFWGTIITLTLLIVFLTINLNHFLFKLISLRAQAVELRYVAQEYFPRYPKMTRWYLLVYLLPILVLYFFILSMLFQFKYYPRPLSAPTGEIKEDKG